MKKYRILALCLVCAILLAGCGGGDVSEVGRQMGEPTLFSEKEVDQAMDEVEKFFKAEFDGCKLLNLRYNEEKTLKEAAGWSEQYGAEVIVLESDFYVDDSGRSVTLEPDETYRNYNWILTKTIFGWELQTWGYG